jgi:hemoglobin
MTDWSVAARLPWKESIMSLASRRMLGVLAVVAMFSLVGCKHDEAGPQTSATATLYEQLGGEKAITLVVNDFVDRAAADPAVNFARKDIQGYAAWNPTPENIAKLKKHLVQFICHATGGPQEYEGRDMKTVHAGMQITDAQFYELTKDLAISLQNYNVPDDVQAKLLTLINIDTHDQIVEKPDAPK